MTSYTESGIQAPIYSFDNSSQLCKDLPGHSPFNTSPPAYKQESASSSPTAIDTSLSVKEPIQPTTRNPYFFVSPQRLDSLIYEIGGENYKLCGHSSDGLFCLVDAWGKSESVLRDSIHCFHLPPGNPYPHSAVAQGNVLRYFINNLSSHDAMEFSRRLMYLALIISGTDSGLQSLDATNIIQLVSTSIIDYCIYHPDYMQYFSLLRQVIFPGLPLTSDRLRTPRQNLEIFRSLLAIVHGRHSFFEAGQKCLVSMAASCKVFNGCDCSKKVTEIRIALFSADMPHVFVDFLWDVHTCQLFGFREWALLNTGFAESVVDSTLAFLIYSALTKQMLPPPVSKHMTDSTTLQLIIKGISEFHKGQTQQIEQIIFYLVALWSYQIRMWGLSTLQVVKSASTQQNLLEGFEAISKGDLKDPYYCILIVVGMIHGLQAVLQQRGGLATKLTQEVLAQSLSVVPTVASQEVINYWFTLLPKISEGSKMVMS